MLYKRLKISIMFLLGLGFTGLQAQESLNAAGSNAFGSGGSVSYSIGQVVYQTASGSNGSVTQGVQQPYEISVITALEEAKGIDLMVSAYPNPTSEYLTLEVKQFDISDLYFQLYDLNGKLLQTEMITGSQTNIDMSHYLPASYFVKVIKENREVKTFQIIKK